MSINTYHYRRGGADIVYLEHAQLMMEQGWETSFFAMQHPENIPCEDSGYFPEELDYLTNTSLSKRLIQASRVIYSLEAKQNIASLLDSKPVDIAHVHNIYHHLSPSVLVELRRRGIPTVLTAHDLKLACPAYTMLNATGVCECCKGGKTWNVVRHRCIKGSLGASALVMMESSIHKAFNMYARNVDKIIAPSRFYRDKLVEWGFSANKIVHIPNFVRDRDGVVPAVGGQYIFYFGRLSKEKGLSTLVRASAQSGVPVWLAGRGPQEEGLRKLAIDLKAPVSFKGFQSGDDLWALIDNARAIVLPSEWYENGPLSVLEAFQRGKPLIGARIGGIPEMIVDGETGWLFEPGDIDGLAQALHRVSVASEQTLRAMSDICREFVVQYHSPISYIRKIEALYSELLTKR